MAKDLNLYELEWEWTGNGLGIISWRKKCYEYRRKIRGRKGTGAEGQKNREECRGEKYKGIGAVEADTDEKR